MSAFARLVLENRLVVLLLTGLGVLAGLSMAPFPWDLGPLPRDPVPVDAIPDIGEAQQIVMVEWPGRSPQDVEDQVTYPLTVQLLGLPGVKTIRSSSMFGLAMVQVILDDDVEFYFGRTRLLEKLSSLPPGLLPDGAMPMLGPDATALGQVFWYTLEGRTPDGRPAGGWDLHELRSLQDFLVKPALASARGVSEVASVGGYVREYQIDVDPDALRVHDLPLAAVVAAVTRSNRDVGARTLEVNQVEYLIRGLGTVDSLDDLRAIPVKAVGGVPVRLSDVAQVHFGPALRRGVLDKDGAEAVGGVVVVRYGENPLSTLAAVKEGIAELSPGLPQRVLPDGTVSKVTVVPFYDRTELILETLSTLEDALWDEILITILVVVVMVLHLRSSLLIAGLLPLAVLLTFVGMRALGIEANIVALSGIAIAIGTMVDLGIVVTENLLGHLDAHERAGGRRRVDAIHAAVSEVGGAVLTAVATTIVSFLPVFGLEAAEGKLFGPLAWTKTLALAAAALVALVVLPAVAVLAFPRLPRALTRPLAASRAASRTLTGARLALTAAVALAATWYLATHWLPLGLDTPDLTNFAFVLLVVGGLLGSFVLFQRVYPALLRLALAYKLAFLALPAAMVLLGLTAWLGADRTLSWLPDDLTQGARARMSGLQGEFMPRLDEGSFLYMPSTMPHASIGAAHEAMRTIDAAIAALPEVEHAVGKLGRVESALDPAPVSMIETVITLKPEWTVAEDGTRTRNWRPEIATMDDLWADIVRVAQTPELTSAPVLQPIETRIVMLQSGMRANFGLKLRGPDLAALEAFGVALERVLSGLPELAKGSVLADRVVGKPYLEIRPDRQALARHGLAIEDVQRVIEVAIGGLPLSRTIEGRESYPIRVRYPPERRLSPEDIGAVLVATADGAQIPLRELAAVELVSGPQMIRGEDTFKTVYVTFGAAAGRPASEVVAAVEAAVQAAIASGEVTVPEQASWRIAGTWEGKVRSDARLMILIPVALTLVFILLYLQFRSTATTLMVFSGVAVAMSGGFLALWAWGQPWFLDFEVFGKNLREVFQVGPVNLSVAVWVGFIALIGIATDDGVVMATYLDQRFRELRPRTALEITEAVVDAGKRRIRPCLMTTATTMLALLPVLTSTGRGADVMIPMAIPAVGGMAFELVTTFVVPVLYAGWQTLRLRWAPAEPDAAPPPAEQLPLPLAS